MKKENKKLTVKQIYSILTGCLLVCIISIIVLVICVANLSVEVKTLEEEKSSMQTEFDLEKSELNEKVTLLSSQLAIRIEAEEAEAQKKVPSGLPVSGKVITIESEPITIATESTVNSQEDAEETDKEIGVEAGEVDEDNIVEQEIPTVVFGVKKETQIVAAGAGTIESVEQVDEGTYVKIDHGNGYISVYLFKGNPKVKEGDEVLRGTLLFEVTSNNAKFSFQILQDGEYVNPMDLMEIRG